jgi:hypothetical protein
MSWKTRLASVALGATAALLVAQEKPATTSTQTTQTTTQQNADGSTTTVTVTGEVVRYEPGRTIVIRDPNKGEITYTLEPSLTVPADVVVGRRVRIFTEPGDGSVKVQRITTITTSSLAASAPTDAIQESVSSTTTTGASRRQTTTTTQSSSAALAAPSAAQTSKTSQTVQTTKTTTFSGTVQAYEPGQSITVIGPGSKTTTYTITEESRLPEDVAVGKRVTVATTIVSGKPVVQSVRYRTTTKTTNTRTKTISPQ